MAQEFRTFTQRLTKERSRLDRILDQGETQIFNVRAKTLVDQFGYDIVDGEGNRIWFPETFDPVEAVAYGKSIARLPELLKAPLMLYNFRQGGPWDLQRSYNGQSGAPFASAFQGAASYVLGLIGAAAGYSEDRLLRAGGTYNKLANSAKAGPVYGNNPDNVPFIVQGARDYVANPFVPPAKIPPGSVPTDTTPANRFDAAFDHSFNLSPDQLGGLVSAVANGNIIPAAGLSDRETRSPMEFEPSEISKAGKEQPQRYLGRYIAGGPGASVAGGGKPAVPFVSSDDSFSPDRSASFDDRFGNWISSPQVAAPLAPYQAEPSQPAPRRLGPVSGEPMPDWPFPLPIWGFPNRSVR